MIYLFLLDLFLILIQKTSIFPCFFLIGFVLERKISLWLILAMILFYDGIVYANAYFFPILLLFYFLKKLGKKKKSHPIIELNFYQILFFLFLLLQSKTSLTYLLSWNTLKSLILNHILMILLIKTKPPT